MCSGYVYFAIIATAAAHHRQTTISDCSLTNVKFPEFSRLVATLKLSNKQAKTTPM